MRKRLFDVSLVIASAPVTAPLLLALILAVWLLEGRPVFFRQERVGKGRRPFWIWKLRTMTCEPEVRQRRPTRLGGWLRQRGLDEVPQILNVLTGEMSLVGPRPLTPEDAARLAGEHAPFAARLEVAPGITGLAQVCGARGAALTARLDADYARGASVATDVAILVRTVWINVVGKRRGARPLPPERAS